MLVVCQQPETVEHLAALTTASQLSTQVASAHLASAAVWQSALVVVVAVTELAALAAAHLPRRPHVLVFGDPQAEDWRHAFEIGAERVVSPATDSGWLIDQVRRAGRVMPAGLVVGVVGCRGGAGASVFACALAVAAVRAQHQPYLIDCDPWGCGLAVMMGVDRLDGLTWDQVSAGSGNIPPASLQTAMSRIDGVAVLGWDAQAASAVPGGVAGSVLDASRLCTPLTLVDLGRGVEAIQQEALTRCDRVLMLVPADVRSVHSARRLFSRPGTSSWEVVVRGPNPGGLLVEDVAAALDVPVLAAVGADRGLDARLERGETPGKRVRTPLGRAGDGLVAEILGR